MGTARDPVVASGEYPECNCRVVNPKLLIVWVMKASCLFIRPYLGRGKKNPLLVSKKRQSASSYLPESSAGIGTVLAFSF
jgi:hypothetical protein